MSLADIAPIVPGLGEWGCPAPRPARCAHTMFLGAVLTLFTPSQPSADPFTDARTGGDGEEASADEYVHIRVQQR